ncbi:zinc-dependent alcohol dehydrogenase [Roseibium sediminis]|uniref:zinc-dependent alcohol dehydrogenase n=1 Tax=Roseibium sediminis TaxID=1775174 RepID=UPI001FCC5CF4|nr:zinc-binding alcohol dehydrogenase [Roseibium sediminis]
MIVQDGAKIHHKGVEIVSETRNVEALWYSAPGTCELRSEPLAAMGIGEVEVHTRFSAISRGTERLVLEGRVPESEYERMQAPFQKGAFPFPVKYGYACTGEVVQGPSEWLGRHVFCLHPHQTGFIADPANLVSVPAAVPLKRAILAANMETALNGLWDGNPSPADQICVVGAGVVGLLTAYLCARIPGTEVTVVDVNPGRRTIAEAFGCRFASLADAPVDQDLVFHASANARGLETALKAAGKDATVVELSWYGDKPVEVMLGADFHSRRLTLRSSQVGTIPAHRQARWTYQRRLTAAINLLADPVIDKLLTHEIAFHDLPKQLLEHLTGNPNVLTPVVRYP